MNGTMDGGLVHNGDSTATTSSGQYAIINQLLNASLDPRVSNELRKAALKQLEDFKKLSEAPEYGYTIARDRTQSSVVRYYGMQILEYALRYTWADFTGRGQGCEAVQLLS